MLRRPYSQLPTPAFFPASRSVTSVFRTKDVSSWVGEVPEGDPFFEDEKVDVSPAILRRTQTYPNPSEPPVSL